MDKGLDILIDGTPASRVVAHALHKGWIKKRTTPEPTDRELYNIQCRAKNYHKLYRIRKREEKKATISTH